MAAKAPRDRGPEENTPKRRRREALSCDSCRAKKTKCDRQLPCGRCVRLMTPHLCVYSSPSHLNNAPAIVRPVNNPSNDLKSELATLKHRLQELEGRVPVNVPPGVPPPPGPVPPQIPPQIYAHLSTPYPGPYPVQPPPFEPSHTPDGPPRVPFAMPGFFQQPSPPLPSPPGLHPHTSPNGIPRSSPDTNSVTPVKSYKERDSFLFESYKQIVDENTDILVGNNPVDDPDGEISFFFRGNTNLFIDEEEKKSVHEYPGPGPTFVPNRSFPFMVLTKRDPGMAVIRNYDSKKEKQFNYKDMFFYRFDKHTNPVLSRLDNRTKELFGDMYVKQVEDGHSISEVKDSLSRWGKPIGVTFLPSEDTAPSYLMLSLEEKLRRVLKSMAPLEVYFDVFFSTLYGYFPIVDENQIRKDCRRIFGEDSSAADLTIKITKEQDLASVALMMYIASLSYSSLLSLGAGANQPSEYPSGPKRQVIRSPVPIEAIIVTEECLNHYNFMRKQPIVVVQACLFAHLFEQYSSIMGDSLSNGSRQSILGVIVQMAMALGLNRDPDYINIHMSEPQKHLRRKLWFILVRLDIYENMTKGVSMCIAENSWDVKTPQYNTQNSNLDPKREQMEKQISCMFIRFRPAIIDLAEICYVVSDVKNPIKLSRLVDIIGETEVSMVRLFGRFSVLAKDSFLIPAESDGTDPELTSAVVMIKGYEYYLQAKLYLVVIFFRLYIYYYNKGNVDLEFFYLRKMLTVMCVELGEFVTDAINIALTPGGKAGIFPIIIIPWLNRYLQILGSLMSSLFCRLAVTVDCSDPSIKTSKKLVRAILADCYHKAQRCSNQVFVSWRHKKAALYMYHLLREPQLYQANPELSEQARVKYTDKQHQELCEIMESYTRVNHVFQHAQTQTDMLSFINSLMDDQAAQNGAPPSPLNLQDEYVVANELQVENFWRQLRNIFTAAGSALVPTPNVESKITQPKSTENPMSPLKMTTYESQVSPMSIYGFFDGELSGRDDVNSLSDIFAWGTSTDK
ncbi:hypothetical protein DIURU_004548 [Diutina rugosa]|uniref:Zn(2)-C6 fungal-type domain-containing protein n=1 Tax=Diutina rugosa TaxID=5481 RepID=A0A642UGV7_DIURU|nr:uncharacterized protein DIURU_004548 [Diutina rugosa]KAA8898704.1 hypothetical protein DIURU_004548 [Diutina rugosa]